MHEVPCRAMPPVAENMPQNSTYAPKGVDQCIKTTNQDGCLWHQNFFAKLFS
jgi:hypothetical protein